MAGIPTRIRRYIKDYVEQSAGSDGDAVQAEFSSVSAQDEFSDPGGRIHTGPVGKTTGYEVVVYDDGGTAVAEDADGDEIASGGNSAAVIQSALDYAQNQTTENPFDLQTVVSRGEHDIDATLNIPSWVRLLNRGVYRLADGTNADMFNLKNTDTEGSVVEGGFYDMNKANNTSGRFYAGINDNAATYSLNDPYNQLRNVYIKNTPGTGVYIEDSLEFTLFNVRQEAPDGIGFDINSADVKMSMCTAGFCGLEGLRTGTETQVSTSKFWYCGQQDETRGDGVYLNRGRARLSNVTSEDNKRHGFFEPSGTPWEYAVFTNCHGVGNGLNSSQTAYGFRFEGGGHRLFGCTGKPNSSPADQEGGIHWSNASECEVHGGEWVGNNVWAGNNQAHGLTGINRVYTITGNTWMEWGEPYALVDASSNTVDVHLPWPDASYMGNHPIVLKVIDATNTITVDGQDSRTIDGNASITLGTGEFRQFMFDGSNWHTIAQGTV